MGPLCFDQNGMAMTPSCFEGLDQSDLRVHKVGVATVDLDFNAYDSTGYNLGSGSYPPGWKGLSTKPRTTKPYGPPRYDMLGYSLAGNGGVLFVCDTFRVREGIANNKDSRSPHDFRLTPMAKLNSESPFFLNPLVNIGVDTSAGTLEFQNFNSSLSPRVYDPSTPNATSTPGLASPGAQANGYFADLATFHAFDWDGEGFGNPRVENRSDFPGPPANSTYIDLGADEMGQLIMAGFIDGTRILSREVPGRTKGWVTPKPPPLISGDNTFVFFMDKYFQGNSYQRPQFNNWIGRGFYYGYNGSGGPASYFEGRWWDFVQASPIVPNPPQGTHPPRFTEGMDQVNPNPPPDYMYSMRRSWVKSGLGAFMRNLECDFSPFLLPDFHPLWGTFNPGWTTVVFNDVFGSNPWYHTMVGNTAVLSDNRFLYYGHDSWIILEGTINPPGSTTIDANFGYLLGGPSGQFGPFGYVVPPPNDPNGYRVDSWGVGDVSPGPDIVPDTENWKGVRFNCQVYYGNNTFSNLQTFLGVNGVSTAPPIGAAYKYPPEVKFKGTPSQKVVTDELFRLWKKIHESIQK